MKETYNTLMQTSALVGGKYEFSTSLIKCRYPHQVLSKDHSFAACSHKRWDPAVRRSIRCTWMSATIPLEHSDIPKTTALEEVLIEAITCKIDTAQQRSTGKWSEADADITLMIYSRSGRKQEI